MPAIGQEQIIVGDELRLYVASDYPRNVGSKDSRDRLPIAFSSSGEITLTNDLVDANNKDVRLYRTLKQVLKGATLTSEVFQSIGQTGRTELENFTQITGVTDQSEDLSRITTQGNTRIVPETAIDKFIEFGDLGIIAQVKNATARTFDVAYSFNKIQIKKLKDIKKLYVLSDDADRLKRRNTHDLNIYWRESVLMTVEFGDGSRRILGNAYLNNVSYGNSSNAIATASVEMTFTSRLGFYEGITPKSRLFGFGSSEGLAKNSFFYTPKIYYTRSNTFGKSVTNQIFPELDADGNVSGDAAAGFYFDGGIVYEQT